MYPIVVTDIGIPNNKIHSILLFLWSLGMGYTLEVRAGRNETPTPLFVMIHKGTF